MKDHHIPGTKWEFNSDVTEVFDDMLKRSIPGFSDMRQLCTAIACEFAQEGTTILDLGCSRGGSLAEIVDIQMERNKYVGIEISKPMLMAAKDRFQNMPNGIKIEIKEMDLRYDFPKENNSVILSILTLQFIPIEYRQEILTKCYESLNKGGVFILVEKILGGDSSLNNLLVKLYYEIKGTNGYSEEQINAKRKALEGVLVPVTADWNHQLLASAGFSNIEMFWRNLNFAGWVGIKN